MPMPIPLQNGNLMLTTKAKNARNVIKYYGIKHVLQITNVLLTNSGHFTVMSVVNYLKEEQRF